MGLIQRALEVAGVVIAPNRDYPVKCSIRKRRLEDASAHRVAWEPVLHESMARHANRRGGDIEARELRAAFRETLGDRSESKSNFERPLSAKRAKWNVAIEI